MRLKRFGSAIAVIALFLSTTVARAADDAKSTAPAASTTAQRYGTWGVDLQGMDTSVKPGDDFFKYVNGKWAATTQIPPDKSGYGAFAVLGDLSEARVHALLDRWAAGDTLKLAGWDEPEKNAADIVALETKIAEAHWTRAQSRDRDKTYNAMTVAELEKSAAGFPWRVAFNEAGLGKVDRVVVRQNTALPKIAQIFADAPVDTLKAWEAFKIVDDAAGLLSKR